MRILFDENVPRKLKWQMEAEVITVPEKGWRGIKNGELLRKAEEEFDVLVTLDQGISHQQNLQDLKISIVILSAISSDIDDLIPLIPSVNRILRRLRAW